MSASGGSSAAQTASASSAPSTSPDGEDTPTSASSSRCAREAISAAASATNSSIGVVSRSGEGQDLLGGHGLGRATLAQVAVGELAYRRVDRGRHSVQAAQQRDL